MLFEKKKLSRNIYRSEETFIISSFLSLICGGFIFGVIDKYN